MLIELSNEQVNRILSVYKTEPKEFIAKMIPFKMINPETLIKVCDNYFGFSVKFRSQSPVIVDARRICMVLLSEYSELPHTEISAMFSGMNYSNISHAKKYIYNRLGVSEKITNDYTKLKVILNEMS